ncbi:MAG: 5-bromo-4-chloroindolyl phosphate hydrolysis family protein [Oscillospiraceae bacterium]
MRKIIKKSSGPIYVAAIVWFLCSMVFPLYRLSLLLLTAVLAFGIGKFSSIFFKPTVICVEEPEPEPQPEPEPEVKPEADPGYSPEVNAIIEEGRRAQSEMRRLRNAIREPKVCAKIDALMQITDKIVEDAKEDPDDIPQIKRFMSYYLPTTIKLLNTYDRMGSQGIEGTNISGTMTRIEDMLDTAIVAYKKQLDALFANQALDIETDIDVMNAMLAREGLGGKQANPFSSFHDSTDTTF